MRSPWLRGSALIRLDWIGGAVVGLVVLGLHGWLARVYGLPSSLVLAMGWANLAYASVSFTLFRLTRGDRVPGLGKMALANILWGLLCFGLAAYWSREATVLGLAQLIVEGLFVGGLGVLEWRASRQDADGPRPEMSGLGPS